jgi:hypothetical protein
MLKNFWQWPFRCSGNAFLAAPYYWSGKFAERRVDRAG